MENTSSTTTSSSGQPLPYGVPPINVTVSGDALLALALGGWLIWDRLLRSTVNRRLGGVFAPVEEERRLTSILAQIGAITLARRVVLCAFHNGAIESGGYHLTKISTINTYTAPGAIPMRVPIRDLPIGRIMQELEDLLEAPRGAPWVTVDYSDDLPEPCKDHLQRNDIGSMTNRIILVGNLPIGILSIQYGLDDKRNCHGCKQTCDDLVEPYYDEISQVMRRRVISPGLIKRILTKLFAR